MRSWPLRVTARSLVLSRRPSGLSQPQFLMPRLRPLGWLVAAWHSPRPPRGIMLPRQSRRLKRRIRWSHSGSQRRGSWTRPSWSSRCCHPSRPLRPAMPSRRPRGRDLRRHPCRPITGVRNRIDRILLAGRSSRRGPARRPPRQPLLHLLCRPHRPQARLLPRRLHPCNRPPSSGRHRRPRSRRRLLAHVHRRACRRRYPLPGRSSRACHFRWAAVRCLRCRAPRRAAGCPIPRCLRSSAQPPSRRRHRRHGRTPAIRGQPAGKRALRPTNDSPLRVQDRNLLSSVRPCLTAASARPQR